MGFAKDLLITTALGFGIGAGEVILVDVADAMIELDAEYMLWEESRKNYTGYNETPTTEMDPNMSIAKKALFNTRNFVARHKTAIACTATAVATTVVVSKVIGGAVNSHDEFLEMKGLSDEYIEWIASTTE